MKSLIQQLVQDLKSNVDLEYKKAQQWFFKEGIDLYGARIGKVREIGREYFRKLDKPNKHQVFLLAEELMEIDKQETFIIALQWVERFKKDFEPRDFKILERWLKQHVNNWARCDALCAGTMGHLMMIHPEAVKRTIPWRKSRNRWVRRASAVSLIKPVRDGQLRAQAFSVANDLLLDADDMVQKGYGWLLKEASVKFPRDVFDFVLDNKNEMPRVSLRYAIERFPEKKRKQAMA